ncbi:MAG TPA: hypothetical protein VGZ73_22195 [Bryobacteraceae bacterium]|nr:hypothetical protein [Bryobacteraceae bacterium]
MSLRCVLLSLLLVSFTFASDQPPSPARPDSASQSPRITTPHDSSPPAKADSQDSHRPHVHFGGLTVGAGYSHFSGAYPYGYWGYSPYYRYDPVLWSGFYHPGYYTGFAWQPNMGNVKISAPDKTSLVYLDGALAGRLDKLKDMWLEPGAYHLEVRNSSHKFTQKIYVLSGKTLKVTPDMMVNEVLR